MTASYTGFRSLHPFPCFIYYVAVMIFSMLLSHPLFLLTAFAAIFVVNLLHDGGRQLRRWSGYYVVIGIVILVANPLISHRGIHILFYLRDHPITLESILYGAMMMISVMTILMAFVSYNQVITPQKFLYMSNNISPQAALLIMMGMRFVPLLRRRLQQISLVQRTRGINPLEGSLRERIHDGTKQLQILLTSSLEEALQTADSMNARGYGVTKRSSYHRYWMRKQDWVALLTMVGLTLICLIGAYYGYGRLTIYPMLEPIAMSYLEWISYGCFFLLLGIPIALEGRERLRWHLRK